MPKKFFVSSDWHVDAVTAGFRRRDDVARSVWKVVEAAKAVEDPKDAVFVFLGDLCDPDSSGGTIAGAELSIRVAAALGHAGIINFWIPGNHCVVSDGSLLTSLSPLYAAQDAGCLPKTFVYEEPHQISFGGYLLHFLPFVSLASAYDPDATVREWAEAPRMSEKVSMFFGHLQVEGAKLGSETYDMPRGRDVAFPVEAVKLFPNRTCFNGHYHLRQLVGEVLVPGALERLTFDEESNVPGFLVVER